MKRAQPSGISGELSGQEILDNSPRPYGLSHVDPLQAGDTCWMAVTVIDPGNEYTLARVRVCGRQDIDFVIHPEALRFGSLERHRKA